MGTADKSLEGMRRNPKGDWRIEDLYVIAKHRGLKVRSQGGSHHVFYHPDVDFDVSVPANRPIKPVYIRQFVKLVDKVNGQAVDNNPAP